MGLLSFSRILLYCGITATIVGIAILGLIFSGLSLIITAIVCRRFPKQIRIHCTIPTSAIALSLSAVGALGLYCLFVWFSITAFNGNASHPIEYPASIFVGNICLVVFLCLITAYGIFRIKKWSFRGLCIDILIALLYLPAFWSIFGYLDHLIELI